MLSSLRSTALQQAFAIPDRRVLAVFGEFRKGPAGGNSSRSDTLSKAVEDEMEWSSRILGIFFLIAGVMHFVATDAYVAMMPVYLPWHAGLVVLSGFLEVLFGAAVLYPPARRMAGFGLILLLIAVFPANIHVALHALPLGGVQIPPLFLWMRLPLQFLLIYGVYRITLVEDTSAESRY